MSEERCTYGIELKLNLALPKLIKIESDMKKYVFVVNAVELVKQILNGKRVEGVLYIDEDTGRLTFKAYNRQQRNRCREKDRLVKKLPWGWVKESQERVKVFGSYPKDYGTATIMAQVDETARDAKNALIDRELTEFC